MILEQVKEKLVQYGQEHLLKYYEELSETEQKALLEQIMATDMSVLSACKNMEELTKKGEISPLAVMQLPEIEANFESFTATGVEAIRAGKVGAVLLAGGAKGKRCMLPNAEAMIHQPLGGAGGQASDVLIRARHLERTRTRLTEILSRCTGKDMDTLATDMDRDFFMNAQESVAYGLVDRVMLRDKQ